MDVKLSGTLMVKQRLDYKILMFYRVFKFSRRPAQVTGYFKHLRRVLFANYTDNSVSPSNSDLIFARK